MVAASVGDASGFGDTSGKSPAANGAVGDKAEMANPSATTSKQAEGEFCVLHSMLCYPWGVFFLGLKDKSMSCFFAL